MDTVAKIHSYVAKWSSTGEGDCRDFIVPLKATDPKSADVLATAWQTLLNATLSIWAGPSPLTVSAVVAFARSTLHALPSSSHDTLPSASNTQALSETLVDTIWALDTQIDDYLGEAKAAAATSEASETANDADVAAAQKAKAQLEKDKETLAELVRRLSRSGILDLGMVRERLDMALVSAAGLISDKPAFDRREIRTRTSLFYKQNKLNLLREQSEGFSKLLAETTSSLPPPHSSITGRPHEPKEAMMERARPVWEHLLSLIGYFDLDPNRALDVILDVFSVHLNAHWSFFLALLRLSPWKGSSERMSWSSEAAPKLESKPVEGQYRGKTLDEVLRIAERDSAPLDTPAGETPQAKVMAQVLGFKFRHYQALDVKETTPQNLSLMAALLIRDGFITLDDLYPHLSPSDDDMEKEHKAYLASIDTRIAAAKVNRLAMAGALESSNSGSNSNAPKPRAPEGKASEERQEKQVPNQKLDILVALLGVGALRPAMAILSKFPWLKDANLIVADLLIRVMRHSLQPLYESKCPPKVERSSSWQQARSRYGPAGVQAAPPRKTMLTLCAPTPPGTNTVDFVYFFPDWVDRIPLCATLEDLEDVIEPIMSFVGLQVSRDTLFMTKFLRLGRQHILPLSVDPETKKAIKVDPEHPIMQFWTKVLRLHMLPALPLIRGNAVCTVEVWNLMRFFETTVRWRFYGEWKTRSYKSHPELRVRAVQADREAKGILRRLSSNTAETLLGPVAKLAHGNPIIFFTAAVNQVMAYDNLASVVILSLRYVTTMGFDVLLYVVLDALANANKPRVKDDGVNISDWLQSLASFTGMLFRRYNADLSPLLKYIVHQLYQNAMTETVVLKELMWKMAGIEPLPSLNDLQVQAMAGGPALRTEAIASETRGAKADPQDMVLKGPARLSRALTESELARPLLIQVAQLREAAAYKADNAHLKSLASLFDGIHGVLMQYLELLTSVNANGNGEYLKSIIPSLAELGKEYGISPSICMQIIRPTLIAPLKAAAVEMHEQERLASEEQEKKLKAALAASRSKDSRIASPAVTDGSQALTIQTNGNAASVSASEIRTSTSEEKMQVDEKSVGDKADGKPVNKLNGKPASKPTDGDVEMATEPPVSRRPGPWVPELEALFGDIQKIVPKVVIETVGAGFYATFWQLSMYDLSPPTARYDETLANLRALVKEEGEKLRLAERSSSRSMRISANSHRQRLHRLNEFIQTLTAEIKEQASSRVYTLKRLATEHPFWFPSSVKATAIAGAVVEHCILPRALLSPMDADYSAQIIRVIHSLGARHWHTFTIYDRILGDHIRVLTFSCSEYEAKNYGRFIAGVLADLYKWFQNEDLFTAENRTKIGGKSVWLHGFQRIYTEKEPVEASSVLTWAQFQTVLRKWHRKLSKSLTECIQTGEYMRVYNAIIILKEILPLFPLATIAPEHGAYISSVMETFIAREDRGDLKILARAYHASLKKREPLWAAPKAALSKPHGAGNIRPSTPAAPISVKPADDRTRTPPAAPTSSSNANGEKAVRPVAPTPSAPRSQLSTIDDKLNTPSIKSAIEVLRPEVIRRVPRPDTPTQPAADKVAASARLDTLRPEIIPKPHIDTRKDTPILSTRSARDTPPARLLPTGPAHPDARPDIRSDTRADLRSGDRGEISSPGSLSRSVSAQARQPPQSPRGHRPQDLRPPMPVMPPPFAPSQTASAQERRDAAKQPFDDRSMRQPPSEPRHANILSRGQSPRRRSSSPPTRPGTRNGSIDSRASGGQPRSDRDNERSDDRADRDTRAERREELPHRERRERPSTRESDRDKGRDRHGDRDRDREREKDRERRSDREREKSDRSDRERDRDRDHDRDRHRRDEKERDRESRKERESAAQRNGVSEILDDRSAPSRPDAPRRDRVLATAVAAPEETLGKRRRPADEESEHLLKRREKRRDEKRRTTTSEDREYDRSRESDRRKRDRDIAETTDTRAPIDKHAPENVGSLPSSTPSAPRAMAGEVSRAPRIDATGHRDRERLTREPGVPSSPHLANDGGNLLSRIGAREDARLLQGPVYRGETDTRGQFHRQESFHRSEQTYRGEQGHRESAWQPPQGPRGDLSARGGDYGMFVPNPRYEARNGAVTERGPLDEHDRRKRTVADREKESAGDLTIANPEPPHEARRTRPRLARNRYADETLQALVNNSASERGPRR